MQLFPEKKYELQEELLTVNMQRLNAIERLDEYDGSFHMQKHVVAFAQFQSMNGAKKFLDSMHVSLWQRLFNEDGHAAKK